jgi:hypothetical protein
MNRRDWEAWEAQQPPSGFADRVVAEALREQRRPRPSRAVRVGVGVVFVAAMAAGVAMTVHVRRAEARGDVTADARREVHVDGRAIAVLEKGAHVRWDGDAIVQDGGDVFWRVEPGARFVVHTPAADVAVKGTCFRVKVRGGDGDMTRRDALSGAVGAALGAAVFVGVYEGRVAVSHAGQSVDVTAGQGAQANARGVGLVGDAASGAAAFDGAGEDDDSEGEHALAEANANLADRVRDYKRRLEGIEAQKAKLERDLAEAQAKLADAGVAEKNEFDLGPDDYRELAQKGEVRMRTVCPGAVKGLSDNDLNKLGLAPQDGPVVQAALQRSQSRAWSVIKPLCAQALGGAADVDHVGQTACLTIIGDLARMQDGHRYDEDVREVAEILAGTRAAPGPNDAVDPVVRAYLALAGESHKLESDLAQALGPDDAKRVVYSDVGCWNNNTIGVGPRTPSRDDGTATDTPGP